MTTAPGPNVILVLVDHDLGFHMVVVARGGCPDPGSASCSIGNHHLPNT